MKIAVFGKLEHEVIDAFMQGSRVLGIEVSLKNPAGINGQPEDGFDLICVNGLHGNNQQIINLYSEKGIFSIVLDYGYTHRPYYHQAGWMGLNWLPSFACESDRASALYGLVDEVQQHDGKYILVCCQKHGDRQHNLPSIRDWAADTIATIKKFTDKPIKFRAHPLYSFRPDGDLIISDSSQVSLEEDLREAHCMVTYNSTAANQALLSGVPVFCDSSAMYADVCNTDLSEINQPKLFWVQDYFNRLAYAQWTLPEIMKGQALSFLLTARKKEHEHDICR